VLWFGHSACFELASRDRVPHRFVPLSKVDYALTLSLSHTRTHDARVAAQAARAAAGDIADGRADGHNVDESIDGSALLLLKLAASESGSVSEKVSMTIDSVFRGAGRSQRRFHRA